MVIKNIVSTKTALALAIGGGASYFLYKFFSQENVSSEDGGAFSFVESDAPVGQVQEVGKKERYVRPNSASSPILVLVGTEYGLSHEVASKLEDELRVHANLFVRIVDMEEYEMLNFEKEQLVLIITSTYGDGVPPTTARPFFDYLEANKLDLSHIQFCVLALGDRSYPLYCAAGKLMDSLFEQCGAKRIQQRVEVDQEDWNVFDRWINSTVAMIPSLQLKESDDDYLYEVAKSFAAQAGKHNKKVPYSSKLLVKRLLTKLGGDKEAFHLEFELGDSELKWIPGDSLAILAHNKSDEVKAVIALLKLASSLKINTPSSHYQEKLGSTNPSQITLEHALTKCYDLHNLKPELLTLLKDHAKNQEEKNKLIELLKEGTSKTNETLHKFLEVNHLVDVLKMFSSARPPVNDILGALGKLLPRYYSIASSMAHNDKTVSLCVAIVRYQLYGTDRVGIASTHMSDRLAIGDQCSIYVNNNPDFRLPEDPSTPILMIGPGTGIAPFVAFIQERLKQNATGEMQLYFGSRSSSLDFLYGPELKQYEADGAIKLYTAFSRETSKKVYVQDRLLENAKEVAELIEKGGHIYVCGDAKSMAPDVHNTLKTILTQHLSIDAADAENYLHKLEKSKRYQKDTWF
ncbi:NADPH-cytochrome-P450 oxidoreductase [Heterostelium album PN500]|uniref:NADPH-cytochrome-P450 oxidoreductase n=1 Tax=Heterostelium pallidum (strain ATCC 26659 / Pp 5 / PN500) TaxID=670386 RepID=D3BES8_HETP5|nr:NADPH-cytochrome-P450 oxidoreductase [Heterostelium album PN500]EFA80409.1 NADPH-cytochrome-P450 oxidoreductase [Heterostelium album PN500]|eukprot:XP_020432529.1 NADPH-cytochrome-P450 oxidoreductase [Heterostelium album PN500]